MSSEIDASQSWEIHAVKVSENPNAVDIQQYDTLINNQSLSDGDVDEEELMAACEEYEDPIESKFS